MKNLKSLQEESEPEPTIVTRAEKEETMPKVVQNSQQGNDGTLSLTLSGNMTLKLKYEFEGQEVSISFR